VSGKGSGKGSRKGNGKGSGIAKANGTYPARPGRRGRRPLAPGAEAGQGGAGHGNGVSHGANGNGNGIADGRVIAAGHGSDSMAGRHADLPPRRRRPVRPRHDGTAEERAEFERVQRMPGGILHPSFTDPPPQPEPLPLPEQVSRLAAHGLDEEEIRARLELPARLDEVSEAALREAFRRGQLLGRAAIKEAQFEAALRGRVTAQTQVLVRLGEPRGEEGGESEQDRLAADDLPPQAD
jgi:hypothetical protein